MAVKLRKQTILPVVTGTHESFVQGYISAQEHRCSGWPMLKYAPREATIVDFLLQAHQVLSDDGIDSECDDVSYIAGILAGWLRRGI
jgi:hypothetical protein